jgi:hypothetical protein
MGQSDDEENSKMERRILTSVVILPRLGEETGGLRDF